MNTYCPQKMLEKIGEQMALDKACKQAGIELNERLVLACYVELPTVDPESASSLISAYEISVRTGLSLAAVKRSIAKLLRKGLIRRRQDVRKAGVIAWTQVTKAACSLLGVHGGAHIAESMPSDLKDALASESIQICALVSKAWLACEGLPTEAAGGWRGGASRQEMVRAALAARSIGALESALETAAVREREQAEVASGLVRIPCPGAQDVVLDAKQLDASIPCPADVGFARDVLVELAVKHPSLVTPTSVPRLLAEVLYSRTVGFMSGRDYEPAVRVLVSCIGSQSRPWGRPRGIREIWYGATAKACTLSTGGSLSVH